MTISNHIAEIARQLLASLTGGWCYDSTNSIFCNTVHLYIWGTFFTLPIILGLLASSTQTLNTSIIIAYVGFIVIFFLFLKIILVYLHNIFDTVEPLIDTKKSSKKSTSGGNAEHSRISLSSFRYFYLKKFAKFNLVLVLWKVMELKY